MLQIKRLRSFFTDI